MVGVRVGPPDLEIDNGQPPYGKEDSNQSRVTHHRPKQAQDPGRVGQTLRQVAGGEELPAAVAEFSPLNRYLTGMTVTPPSRSGPPDLPYRC